MRGIGAVIHFRSPTPGSTSAPDFSGMWSSIRDWFALSAQDEAAQCFRVFYQPDEGMSPPNRLKHFLRLKALASPGRQANFTAERIPGTGETICMIASGKNSDFPSVTLHLSDQEWHSTQHQKEAVDSPRSSVSDDNQTATVTGTGGSVEARPKGAPITRTQIQAWQELSPEAKRETGGWKVWAQSQGINIGSAGACLTHTGLTPKGTIRLQPPEERGSSITNAQIQVWRDLPQEAKREAGGWKVWAQTQGISINSACACLTHTGLTPRGAVRLQPPGERGTPITNQQIRAWQDLPLEAKREAGGWKVWAQAQGITIGSAGIYLINSGLTPFGTERLKPTGERGTSITNQQIRMWRDLPQEAKHEAGGWMTWAQAQGIDINSASVCLTSTGLKPKGAIRLQPPGERGSPITEAQLLAWLNMSPEERRTSGGWATWAQARGISYISARKYLAPTDSEMSSRGTSRPSPPSTVTSDSPQASTSAATTTSDEIAISMSAPPEYCGEKRSLPSTKADISAPPAKQIKEEEDDVTWRTHQINNNLPILQHWRDPAISVMARAEGRIETLQVTRWGPLFNLLSRKTKARINQDIRWFLQNEGKHDARMNAMISVAIPLDDSDGYRGRTVYARTNLAAFTVLGPYSGRLLDSEKVRCEYEKEYGREA
ncbi:TPA: SET domain-containing protein-lysine N-methyltransferase, partial [Salmonella enterica subsp. enterica serovar Paratyphi B]|nr:SET domain-containing protein-lysine N-methyltransferase [Salmonella enterica subsp. enterica serovar Java]EAU9523755.1 SET domain-containing protein-lysine N-methyltransferase [Salmonella enterica]HAB5380554.1 SET domain-containing protein-lysine N-methyltransferase [Salmonella enterica subsp. enterica]HBJ6988508.1 SET domain-containing protein-lysine N-methyltransferase [Salmonella enterica subsp. enterica serovar Infantis]HCC0000110.1 SET domain-containing protein-lysine N-methyltransfera